MSKDSKLFDNKILVLYVLKLANKPLTIEQISTFSNELDCITYLDICDYIQNLEKNGYIIEYTEDETILYKLSDEGIEILAELLELVPGINLHNLKKMIDKNLVEVNTEYSVNSNIFPIKQDEYKISCYIKDGNDELVNISIYAGTKEQAKNISKNWQQNSDKIYSTLIELMTKDIQKTNDMAKE